MQNELNVNINLEKIKHSSSALKNILDGLESSNSQDYFYEMENQIKDINYYHGNCITNYKESINQIIEEITRVKTEIRELESALTLTYSEFSDKLEKETSQRISIDSNQTNTKNNNWNLSALTNDIQNSNVTTIPPEEEHPQTEPEQINTVPIGLGIAAAGITGAVGAVVVDSMNQTKPMHFESYHERPSSPPEQTNQKIQQEQVDFDLETPYHASRNHERINIFYSDNNDDSDDNDFNNG